MTLGFPFPVESMACNKTYSFIVQTTKSFSVKCRCNFATSKSFNKIVGKNLKGKKSSSINWINRQINDPYAVHAAQDGWRCRSAYKLLQMQEKSKIMKPGDIVIDCGAAPGSWSQVAVQTVNANGEDPALPVGTVIGVDLQRIQPLDGAVFLDHSDFTNHQIQSRILQILAGKHADVVLSDIAPNATGVKSLNQELIMDLCLSVLRFSTKVLKQDGHLLCKVWDGHEKPGFQKGLEKLFKKVKIIKPKASRSDSAEIYLLGSNFMGLPSHLKDNKDIS